MECFCGGIYDDLRLTMLPITILLRVMDTQSRERATLRAFANMGELHDAIGALDVEVGV